MNKAFSWFWGRVQAQPVYAQGVVHGAVSVGCAFGLGWSGQQVAMVNLLSAAILAFLTQKAVSPISRGP